MSKRSADKLELKSSAKKKLQQAEIDDENSEEEDIDDDLLDIADKDDLQDNNEDVDDVQDDLDEGEEGDDLVDDDDDDDLADDLGEDDDLIDDLGEDDDDGIEDLVDDENQNDLKEQKNLSKEDKIKKIKEFNEKQARKGVVYISRVPPYMKASFIRKYFQRFGVERIYLTPEENYKQKQRKRSGGNKRRKYIDGWIEFKEKRIAKFVAASYNTKQIGGKKSGYYSQDLWNLRYLSKFKWDHLTEKIAYDHKMRKERLKAELNMEKKKHDYYMEQVDKSKKIMGMINKKEAKRKALENIDSVLKDAGEEEEEKDEGQMKLTLEKNKVDNREQIRRMFKQKKPKFKGQKNALAQ